MVNLLLLAPMIDKPGAESTLSFPFASEITTRKGELPTEESEKLIGELLLVPLRPITLVVLMLMTGNDIDDGIE